jgi:ubiquinone/menaquinone biosynthesis C-methylase UbiE
VRPLLDAVGIDVHGAGCDQRILDMATGPGYGAGEAALRGAIATGLDISGAMVALASQSFPNATFIEGDGQNLPFPDENFDVVISNFGMAQMANPARAIAEAYRVQSPGGRYGFSLRAEIGKDYNKQMVHSAVRAHGNMNLAMPLVKEEIGLHEPHEYEPLLKQGGFTKITTSAVTMIWQPKTDQEILDSANSGSRSSMLLGPQTPEAREKIDQAMLDFAAQFKTADGYKILRFAALLTAQKE